MIALIVLAALLAAMVAANIVLVVVIVTKVLGASIAEQRAHRAERETLLNAVLAQHARQFHQLERGRRGADLAEQHIDRAEIDPQLRETFEGMGYDISVLDDPPSADDPRMVDGQIFARPEGL